MKTFNELSDTQKAVAVIHCRNKAHDLLKSGVVESDRPLNESEVNQIGDAMAEEAWYSERTDTVIADIADGK